MKQVIMATALWLLLGCQKNSNNSNTNTGLASQPTATASFDNQSGGVYKGSLTGSSGYFEVNLQGSRPFIIFQWTNPAGNIDSLFTTSLASWASGQAIVKAVFTGSDGSFFWFSVGAGGSNPSIDSVHIVGHTGPVYVSVAKELSSNQIKVYQGTATVPGGPNGNCENATVNMWIANSTGFFSYLGTKGDFGAGGVTVSGNQVQIPTGTGGSESGTLTSSDGLTYTGTVAGGSCSHSVTLTRVL